LAVEHAISAVGFALRATIGALCPSGTRLRTCERSFQNLIVLSSDAEITRSPEQSNFTSVTPPEWPLKMPVSFSDFTSQRRMVWSSDADATARPSGLMATPLTFLECHPRTVG